MTATDQRTEPDSDQRVFLHGVSWEQYEQVLAIRGESSAVRISYLRGALELMSPSTNHELIKKTIARLVEAWADEHEIDLSGFGSWTVTKKELERGLEPDECYVLGTEAGERPDLAIEVVWTSGGIDKLEIYRGLGVPEVWFWQDRRIRVFVLRGEDYVVRDRSELLPGLDLAELVRFVDEPSQPAAARAYRRLLRERHEA